MQAEPDHFGVCVVGTGGAIHAAGDVDVPFTLMSVAKPFVFALVLEALGPEEARARIGANATGLPFNTLWEERARREPVLVVIDEAHNVCSAEPEGELSRISSAQAVQIAAEGRKYGLYLLASTQRPNKVHENVVSQCDNLLLMRMNSAADLADLSALFSFVPEGLVAGATSFRMGQALVVGKILPQPAYVQMGRLVSHEGGVDIPATWAEPR